MRVAIQPSGVFPDVTALLITPDEAPGYVYVDFEGGAPLKVSMAAAGTDDEVRTSILSQLGLSGVI